MVLGLEDVVVWRHLLEVRKLDLAAHGDLVRAKRVAIWAFHSVWVDWADLSLELRLFPAKKVEL